MNKTQTEEYPDAKIAVYTCILPHSYNVLRPPVYINEDKNEVHYWVISDEPHMTIPWYDMVVTPDPNLTPRRDLQKYKMCSHKYMPEYDWVIWIDGWAWLLVDPVEIINEVKESGKKVAIGKHPWRDCSYDEGRVCAGFPSNDEDIIKAQLSRYEEAGFPHNYGLAASSFFVRDNKDPKTKTFFNRWYRETMKGSHRNQISWGYAAWKSKLDALIWDMPWGSNRFYDSEKGPSK